MDAKAEVSTSLVGPVLARAATAFFFSSLSLIASSMEISLDGASISCSVADSLPASSILASSSSPALPQFPFPAPPLWSEDLPWWVRSRLPEVCFFLSPCWPLAPYCFSFAPPVTSLCEAGFAFAVYTINRTRRTTIMSVRW